MKLLKKILRNPLGMSMMEMVVAGGLAGGAALGVAALLKSMGGSSKDAEMIIERTEFGSALGVFLNSANGCSAFKQGPAIAGTEAPFVTGDWVGSDGKTKEWKFDGFKNFANNKDLRLNNIKYLTAQRNDIPGLNPMTLKIGASIKTLKKAVIKVKLGITEKSKNRDAAQKRAEEDSFPEIRFEYNVPVLVDNSTNVIEICGDNSTLAESCYILKGIFDSATGKCDLPKQCESFGSYAVLDCAPKISQAGPCSSYNPSGYATYTNPVTGGNSCPTGASTVSTGGQNWYRDVDCGKKCTARVNYSIGYYSCLKCN